MQSLINQQINQFRELMKVAHEDHVMILADESERHDNDHLLGKYVSDSLDRIMLDENPEYETSVRIHLILEFRLVVLCEVFRRHCLMKEKLTVNN